MYKFRVSPTSGSFGWIHWRNTIPDSVLPAWMSRLGTFWGTMSWASPISEEAFRELVKISEELGLYGEPLPISGDQSTSDLEH